jgi:hypothetical protein
VVESVVDPSGAWNVGPGDGPKPDEELLEQAPLTNAYATAPMIQPFAFTFASSCRHQTDHWNFAPCDVVREQF